MSLRVAVVLCALLAGACSGNGNGNNSLLTGATAATGATKEAEVPRCAQPFGTVALAEKKIPALEKLGLPSPSPLINTFISQSGCFQILDQEAAKLAKGKGGKAPTPNYLLTADLLEQNPNAGGIKSDDFASFIPSNPVKGSASVKVAEVRTALFLSDTTNGLQLASVQGYAQSADVGGSVDKINTTNVKLGAYTETANGKAATASFLDAYIKLVDFMKTKQPKVAAAKR
jgi:hypothetical protein